MKQNSSKRSYIFLILLISIALLFLILFNKTNKSSNASLKNQHLKKYSNGAEAQKMKIKKFSKKLTSFNEKEKSIIKKRRSKARLALSSSYSAQKAFWMEYKRYSSDLILMGITPVTEDGILYYKIGFLSEYQVDNPITTESRIEDSSLFNSDRLIAQGDLQRQVSYSDQADQIDLGDYQKFCKQECIASKDSFELIVVFPYPNQKGFEVWTINQKKQLKKVSSIL